MRVGPLTLQLTTSGLCYQHAEHFYHTRVGTAADIGHWELVKLLVAAANKTKWLYKAKRTHSEKVRSPWNLDSSGWNLGTSLRRQSTIVIYSMCVWIIHPDILISGLDCKERRWRYMEYYTFNKRRTGKGMHVWDLMTMIRTAVYTKELHHKPTRQSVLFHFSVMWKRGPET